MICLLLTNKTQVIIPLPKMKKNTMLISSILILTTNIYSIFISTYFQPITPAMLTSSLLLIFLIIYVELNKRRVLMHTRKRQSHVLFVMIILCMVYYVITSFTCLVYLNQIQQGHQSALKMQGLIVGLDVMPLNQVIWLNLPYYFINLLLLMFYLRCYYVMFWSQNIIFIFRYLKQQCKELNQTLLAHLPKVEVTQQMTENICALCLQNYQKEQNVSKVICQHIFHLDCIKLWVTRSNCCPLCRKRVII